MLIVGTNWYDVLVGTENDDQIFGGDGDDQIRLTRGQDSIDGGAGSDYLIGDADKIGIPAVARTYVLNSERFFDSTGTLATLHSSIESVEYSDRSGQDITFDSTGFYRPVVLKVGAGNHTIRSGDYNDLFHFSGAGNDRSFVDGGQSMDILLMEFGAGDARLTASGSVFTMEQAGTREISTANMELTYAVVNGTHLDASTLNQYMIFATRGSDNVVTGGQARNQFQVFGDGNLLTGGAMWDTYIFADFGVDKPYFKDTVITNFSVEDMISVGSGGSAVFVGNAQPAAPPMLSTLDPVPPLEYGTFAFRGSTYLTSWNGYFLQLSNTAIVLVESSPGSNVLVYGGLAPVADPAGTAMSGTAGTDVLEGGAGQDRIDGLGGNDLIDGGADDDIIDGGSGNDWIYGGSGNDTITGGAGVDTIRGDDGDDVLTGENGMAEWLLGGRGNDTMTGIGGTWLMYGGDVERAGAESLYFNLGGVDLWFKDDGNDTMTVVDGERSVLAGGSGNDIITIVRGTNNSALGLAGDDVLRAIGPQGDPNDSFAMLHGDGGNDVLISQNGRAGMHGGTGADTYYVDGDNFVMDYSGEGYDRIATSASFTLEEESEIEQLEALTLSSTAALDLAGNVFANLIIGNNGANVLSGAGGSDRLLGLGGNDLLFGGEQADWLEGGAGNDTYYVDDAGDRVVDLAGEGTDRVATVASYQLSAGAEIERFDAMALSDTQPLALTGNEFGQLIVGNAGDNVIDGGAGHDLLVGYSGRDLFAFTTALGSTNVDRIDDFRQGEDRIAIDEDIFGWYNAGSLDAATLRIGSAAQDDNDFLIYDPVTGALLFDADGNGSTGAVQFATLAAGLSLVATDFIVI